MSAAPRLLTAAVLLGLVAGVAAGAGAAWGEVHATSVRAEGSASLAATVVALLQEQTGAGTGGADPLFSLLAQQLRVEVDSADPSLHEVGVFPTVNTSHHANASVDGLLNREGYRWDLFSLEGSPPPRIELSTVCAQGSQSRDASITRQPIVRPPPASSGLAPPHVLPSDPGRPSTVRDTSASLQWGCLGGGTAKVTGDFQLSLWGWDARLTDASGSRLLMSGREPSGQAPAGAPDLSGMVSHRQEVYLFAKDAVLVTALRGAGYSLHTEASVLSASALQLEGADGRIDVAGHAVDLASSAVQLGGDLQASLAGAGVGRPFEARLAGTPDAVVVDGRLLSLPAATVGASFPWLWMAGAAGVGAVLAPPALRLASRRLAPTGTPSTDAVEAARERMEEGDSAGGLRLAERAIKADRNDPEAHFLRALCLGRLGQSGKALAVHRDTDTLLQALIRRGQDLSTLRAENAFEAARCCMRLAASSPGGGHREQAAGWLKAAIRLQGIFVQESQEDPLLAGLLGSLERSAPEQDWWNQP